MAQFIALKTRILEEDTPWMKPPGFLVTEAFVVHSARIRVPEVAHEPLFNIHDFD
jgi:hypothetical protein